MKVGLTHAMVSSITWLMLSAILIIATIAAVLTAVSVYTQRRYRGRRRVSDAQWEAWAVDTQEWKLEDDDEYEDDHGEEDDEAYDPASEGLLGAGRGDPVAAPDDLEAGRGPHDQ